MPTERIVRTKKETESVDPQGGVGDGDDERDDDVGDKKIAAIVNKETAARQLVKTDSISWGYTCRGMRNEETVERYINLMDLLTQGVVTFK